MTIFISRQLTENSPIRKAAASHHIIARSLLEFRPVPFSAIPECDWIFFYSRKGVEYFFSDMSGRKFRNKWAAIGPSTAAALRRYTGSVSFTGNGDSIITGPAFEWVAKGQMVLFPRAANSRRSMQKALRGKIEDIDLIVYRNEPKKDIDLPPCDILIFTSPLNADAYFNTYPDQTGSTIIGIGNTTTIHLQDLGCTRVFTPKDPSEEAIAELLVDLGF